MKLTSGTNGRRFKYFLYYFMQYNKIIFKLGLLLDNFKLLMLVSFWQFLRISHLLVNDN